MYARGDDANGDSAVAIEHHQQWKQEEQPELLVVTHQLPFDYGLVCVATLFTHPATWFVLPYIVEDHVFKARDETENPDDRRHGEGVHPPAALGSRDGMDHSQVAIEGHEREEEDGAGKADRVQATYQLAEGRAKDPLGTVVDSPERQGGGEQEVRDDQVEQEDVGDRTELLILVDDAQNQTISQKAQQEVHVVERRDEQRTKLNHVFLFAQNHSLVVHDILWVFGDVGRKKIIQIFVILVIHGNLGAMTTNRISLF